MAEVCYRAGGADACRLQLHASVRHAAQRSTLRAGTHVPTAAEANVRATALPQGRSEPAPPRPHRRTLRPAALRWLSHGASGACSHILRTSERCAREHEADQSSSQARSSQRGVSDGGAAFAACLILWGAWCTRRMRLQDRSRMCDQAFKPCGWMAGRSTLLQHTGSCVAPFQFLCMWLDELVSEGLQ